MWGVYLKVFVNSTRSLANDLKITNHSVDRFVIINEGFI